MHQQQGSERTGTPYFQVAFRFVIFFISSTDQHAGWKSESLVSISIASKQSITHSFTHSPIKCIHHSLIHSLTGILSLGSDVKGPGRRPACQPTLWLQWRGPRLQLACFIWFFLLFSGLKVASIAPLIMIKGGADVRRRCLNVLNRGGRY